MQHRQEEANAGEKKAPTGTAKRQKEGRHKTRGKRKRSKNKEVKGKTCRGKRDRCKSCGGDKNKGTNTNGAEGKLAR